MPNPREQHAAIVLWAVVFEGGMAVVAWSLGWLMERGPADQFRWNWTDPLWSVAATLPMLPALWWITHSRWRPFHRLSLVVRRLIAPLFASCSLLDLALISILAGLGEEALFRGVIQTAVAGYAGPIVGVAVASVLFGMAHLVTPTYGVLAALFGAYLGCIFLTFDSLLPPVIVHALYDFFALVYLVKRHHKQKSPAP